MSPGERRVRVLRTLPASVQATDPPLRVRPGAWVTVGERSTDWPAFRRVRTDRGEVGWVPERCLGRERPRTRVRRAFDTTSLGPALGEPLTVLVADPATGWAWCRDADGRAGWYPLDYLGEF